MNSKFIDGVEVRGFGIEKYWASKDGRIWSDYWDKWMKPGLASNSGYAQINLTTTDGPKRFSVHRLVALAWLGEPDVGREQVNHKNGDKRDNRIENLEWASQSENVKHAIASGLLRAPKPTPLPGESNPMAKLTEEDVRAIRLMSANGHSQSAIGKVFEVSQVAVGKVLLGKTWGHVK